MTTQTVSDFVDFNEQTGLDIVLKAMAKAPNPRQKELFENLLRHMYSFIKESRPTPEEWQIGLDWLLRTGQMSTEHRNEFALFNAVMGFEVFVELCSNQNPQGAIPASPGSALGPFYNANPPQLPNGADITGGVSGTRVILRGRVTSIDGKPLPNAVVDIWQTDENGDYDVQTGTEPNLRGRFITDSEGHYWCVTVRAHHYEGPTDGTVGELLRAMGRDAMRPSHVHFKFAAPGYATLTTAIYPSDDPFLNRDAAFGTKSALLVDYVPATDADKKKYDLPSPFLTLDFDAALVPVK